MYTARSWLDCFQDEDDGIESATSSFMKFKKAPELFSHLLVLFLIRSSWGSIAPLFTSSTCRLISGAIISAKSMQDQPFSTSDNSNLSDKKRWGWTFSSFDWVDVRYICLMLLISFDWPQTYSVRKISPIPWIECDKFLVRLVLYELHFLFKLLMVRHTSRFSKIMSLSFRTWLLLTLQSGWRKLRRNTLTLLLGFMPERFA